MPTRTALSYLASKKFIVIVASLFAAGGILWFVSGETRPDTKNPIARKISNAQSVKEEHIDTDGDGVEDWQEVLAGANPRDPNSKPSKEQLVLKMLANLL